MPDAIAVCVVGASGRLGAFACERIEATPGFALVGRYTSSDDWPRAVRASGARVGLEATRAGLGAEHAALLLEAGVRPVVGTSGVGPEETARLDGLARARGLGGIVVPNFALGMVLLQELAERAAALFPRAEIVETHRPQKRDAPSGTSVETARRIRSVWGSDDPGAVPIHSRRLPGTYAHQSVAFGGAGEVLTLRHDMQGPEGFAAGLELGLRYAAGATGVAYGLEAALARS